MTIRKKMILILLICTIIPMCFVGMLGFYHARKTLESLRIEELKGIADLKAKMIEDYIADHKKHISVARLRPTLKKNAALLADFSDDFSGPVYATIKEDLDRALTIYQPVYSFVNVLLVNPQGRIVYILNRSSATDMLGRHIPDLWGTSFADSKARIQFSDILESKIEPGRFSMFFSAPIHSENGKWVGFAAFETDMEPIYDLIQNTTGLGETGETFIAQKAGNQALYLNPLRHDPGAALQRKIDLGERQALPVQEALNGNIGSGISVDYRGQKVIAAWRFIRSIGWGMVAKIDLAEAFEPVTTLRDFVLVLVIAVIVLSIFAAFTVAKSISDPIQALQRGATEIGHGNLDHKVATHAQDEIGQLGRAFDQMTEKLKEITASRDMLDREVSERKKVENALRLMKFSLDNSSEMIYWMDAAGNIVDVNDTTCDRLGYARKQIVASKVDVFDPNIKIEDYPAMWQNIKQLGFAKLQSSHQTKAGRPIPVEITLNYIRFGGKEYLCAFARDITERKQAEEELQKSMGELEERVKELNCLLEISRLIEKRELDLDDILQGIVNLMPSASQYPEITCAKLNINGKEWQTSNFMETIWQKASNIIVHGVPRGNLVMGYLEEREDRDEGPFLKEERALLDAVAERVGRIIERKWAQEGLQESEKRFRDLVEHSLTGISIVQDNQVVYQNREQERLLGPLPRSYLLTDFEKIHPEDVEGVKRLSRKMYQGEAQTLETDIRFYPEGKKKAGNGLKWVYCRALATEFRGHEAILVNMIDMTQAKELEHLLRIQDKVASLGRVAAGMAHEIRNPLSGINVYLNTLEKLRHKANSEEKVKQIMRQIQTASNKIESVIRRVMDFAKPGEPKLAETDLNRPVKDAINLSAVTMRKSGFALEENLAQNLPPCRADARLIEEMVLNLLNNAGGAMQTMAEGKKIVVSTFAQGDKIILTVSDSGPGVSPDIRDKIFDPFYTTKSDGTGIGLSICHRIATDHGGSISVSESGLGGAEFRVRIPYR